MSVSADMGRLYSFEPHATLLHLLLGMLRQDPCSSSLASHGVVTPHLEPGYTRPTCMGLQPT